MSNLHLDALCLNLSPRLKRFDVRLLQNLSSQMRIGCWEYSQTLDEPCCLSTAVHLLHDYVRQGDRPLHLIGHGVSGSLALLYAKRYPQWVRSLTVLSVGENPATSWHSHYYALLHLLPCHRPMILAQMVRLLFGPQSYPMTNAFVRILAADLDSALSPHSLVHQTKVNLIPVRPPVFATIGGQDQLINPLLNQQDSPWLKASDRVWSCPEGRHFFHYEYPQQTADAIAQFWYGLESATPAPLLVA